MLCSTVVLVAAACGDGGGSAPSSSAAPAATTAKPSASAKPAPSAAPTATAEATATAAPAAAGAPPEAAQCPPDTKLDVPGVCIKLPAGFAAQPAEKFTSGGAVELKSGSKKVRLSWKKRSPPDLAEGVTEMEGSAKHGKNAVWGDTPGASKGRWVRYEQPSGQILELSAVVVGENLVSCVADVRDAPGACPGLVGM
jgi:hypothetical protein